MTTINVDGRSVTRVLAVSAATLGVGAAAFFGGQSTRMGDTARAGERRDAVQVAVAKVEKDNAMKIVDLKQLAHAHEKVAVKKAVRKTRRATRKAERARAAKLIDRARNEGYNSGNSAGFGAGHSAGKEEGKTEGYDSGFDDAWNFCESSSGDYTIC
jgi:flagellar biosynthesis/type III secretory pathway protein FliH